jgi:hypothetical protein
MLPRIQRDKAETEMMGPINQDDAQAEFLQVEKSYDVWVLYGRTRLRIGSILKLAC